MMLFKYYAPLNNRVHRRFLSYGSARGTRDCHERGRDFRDSRNIRRA